MKPLPQITAPSGTKTPSIRQFVLRAASVFGLILLHPNAVPAQDMYVTNFDNGTVEKFTPDGQSSLFISSGIYFPSALAFDTASNLYVVDGHGDIVRYAPDGTSAVFVSTAPYSPTALAFDAAGNLYAPYEGAIHKFAPNGIASVFANTDADDIEGLAIDASGNLYAAGLFSGIEKFTPEGTASVFATAGPSGFSDAVSDAAGNLFVTDRADNTVRRVAPDGTLTTFANTGLDDPEALAFDPAGNLYVTSTNDSTVVRFTPNGVGTVFASAGLRFPGGLAIDAAGNVYVANVGNSNIMRFAPDGTGTVFATIGGPGVPTTPLALDSAGNLYAVIGSNTIERYTPAGVGSVFSQSYLIEDPGVLAFDKAGNLYAGEGFVIVKITPDGAASRLPNGFGDGGLVFDAADDLYAVSSDGTIKRYAPDGSASVVVNPRLSQPLALACDPAGNLFVANNGNSTIEKFAPDGTASLFANAGVSSPTSLAVDVSGNVYVGNNELENSTIELFTPDGVGTVFASGVDRSVAMAFSPSPPSSFFNGAAPLGGGVYYLSFAGSQCFGYYSLLADRHYIYHYDLGFEYVFDAADGANGVYFYDFKSGGFFYTSPIFPFPYLYDFSLKSVLYYYPDPTNPGHYNTGGVRYFYDFATGQMISK